MHMKKAIKDVFPHENELVVKSQNLAGGQLKEDAEEVRAPWVGTFESQKSDMEMWVSIALTNEDTCLEAGLFA